MGHKTARVRLEKFPLRLAALSDPGHRQIPYALPFALRFQANRGRLRRRFSQAPAHSVRKRYGLPMAARRLGGACKIM